MSKDLTEKEKERFKAFKLHEQGYSRSQIAHRMGRPVKWVKRLIRRFSELGHFGDRAREGRPKKMTSADHHRLVKMTKGRRRRSTRKVAKLYKTTEGQRLGRETVRKVFKSEGLFPHKPRRLPKLTEEGKKKRVQFCRKYRRADFHKWVFYDEKECLLYHRPNPKNEIIWNEKGKAFEHEEVKHPPKFAFGTATTARGVTRLAPYTGTLDSTKYQNLLPGIFEDVNKMYPEKDWVWVQDSARPHVSKSSQEFLSEHVPQFIPPEDWPANSPDMNIEENVYGFLQDKIDEVNPETKKELELLVRRLWRKISPEECQKFVSTLPQRMKKIIETDGEYCY